jgi:hypothetical protein
MTVPNTNSEHSNSGSPERPNQENSGRTNGDSQSASVRGQYVPLPGQGPDYVSKGDQPRRTND